MTRTYLAGVLAGAALMMIGAAQPVLAQDEGKTAAAELASESQAALQQLYADRTSGEGARAEGACHPGVSRGHEGRPRESAGSTARAPC